MQRYFQSTSMVARVFRHLVFVVVAATFIVGPVSASTVGLCGMQKQSVMTSSACSAGEMTHHCCCGTSLSGCVGELPSQVPFSTTAAPANSLNLAPVLLAGYPAAVIVLYPDQPRSPVGNRAWAEDSRAKPVPLSRSCILLI